MPHDADVHREAVERGDYADEILFDHEVLTVALLHFADGTHSVRLDLFERGLSLVLDTPPWLDLDTVLPEVSEAEPTLGSGYVSIEREPTDDDVAYRLTIQGGDLVGRVSVILLQPEVDLLKQALEASREAVESADTIDHEEQIPGLKEMGGLGGLGNGSGTLS
jgi:hypothetical protein